MTCDKPAEHCRHCSWPIVLTCSHPNCVRDHLRGFCSPVCRKAFDGDVMAKQKALDLQYAKLHA